MNFMRSLIGVADDVCKSGRMPTWIRWPAYIAGIALFIWPYLEMLDMLEFTNVMLLTCAVALILGAVLGETLIMAKARAMGNTIEKTDFLGIVIGLCLGVFCGYLGLSMFGGSLTSALGDVSYPVIALVCSAFSAVVITLFSMAMAGETWAVTCLDVNKDGKVDVKDVTAAAEEVKDAVEEAVGKTKTL